MLTLVLGRAGSGKTSYIFDKLRAAVEEKRAGNLLIVPEQYSHGAERALAAAAGDEASLYAEVLSFSRLADRVFAEVGGLADRMLDGGGRVLAMSLAVTAALPELTRIAAGGRRPDFLRGLLASYDELRSSRITGADLYRASLLVEGSSISAKLRDLAVIFESYEAVKAERGCDDRDRMERLADGIGESSVGSAGEIFIDGFSDFTAQEMRVLTELMKKDANITACLTCPSLEDAELLFRLPAHTARLLKKEAEERGHEVRIVALSPPEGASALRYMERKLWANNAEAYPKAQDEIALFTAAPGDECALAAAKVLELVRNGARYRDIAVVSPDWDRYEPIMRGVFERCGIPLGVTEKTDVLEKPVTAMLTAALDVVSGGWEYEDVFRCLKTGLAGVPAETVDELENYALKWTIRGERAWRHDWLMHPDGYSGSFTGDEAEKLAELNRARRKFAEPLATLQEELRTEATAAGKARAVYRFMEGAGLYEAIEARRERLADMGDAGAAEEYRQLWDILVGALGQLANILGETETDTEEFIRLLRLVLTQYKVGLIPATIDAVHAGSMDRVRPRGLRHLVAVGCSDAAMAAGEDAGVFTEDEREKLREAGLALPDPDDDRLSRSIFSVYSSLTLPSGTLTVSYPSGERPAYIVKRLAKLFALRERPIPDSVHTAAAVPAFEYAAAGNTKEAAAARAYFDSLGDKNNALSELRRAAKLTRGRLTKKTAAALYGKNLNLSPSRVEKFYSCRRSYFLRYGLKLKPRTRAGLTAPEMGTFMHFVLERSIREIERRGGYGGVTVFEVEDIVSRFVAEYADGRLGGLASKPGRFAYLYDRLAKTAAQVVWELCTELGNSEFRPMDFELSFARDGDMPPIELSEDGVTVTVNGVADRVDGWVAGDDLYLRVVDYKTGKRAMSISDVWYGLGMQMLIYLFALEKEGAGRYGKRVIPAGVLYAPARSVILSRDHDADDLTLRKKLLDEIKRSGVILDDRAVVEAMERPDAEERLLPVKFTKTGEATGDNLLSLEKLGRLSRLVRTRLIEMGKLIVSGSVEADPCFRSQQENACAVCDYFDACHFGDAEGDAPRRIYKLGTDEVLEGVDK